MATNPAFHYRSKYIDARYHFAREILRENNKTLDIVSIPKNEEIIDSRWIFREKKSDNETTKKARLVARGYQQKDTSKEVYSPVARMLTIRCLSLSFEDSMHIHHLHLKWAFLHGILKKPVYLHIPKGVEGVSQEKYACCV